MRGICDSLRNAGLSRTVLHGVNLFLTDYKVSVKRRHQRTVSVSHAPSSGWDTFSDNGPMLEICALLGCYVA